MATNFDNYDDKNRINRQPINVDIKPLSDDVRTVNNEIQNLVSNNNIDRLNEPLQRVSSTLSTIQQQFMDIQSLSGKTSIEIDFNNASQEALNFRDQVSRLMVDVISSFKSIGEVDISKLENNTIKSLDTIKTYMLSLVNSLNTDVLSDSAKQLYDKFTPLINLMSQPMSVDALTAAKRELTELGNVIDGIRNKMEVVPHADFFQKVFNADLSTLSRQYENEQNELLSMFSKFSSTNTTIAGQVPKLYESISKVPEEIKQLMSAFDQDGLNLENVGNNPDEIKRKFGNLNNQFLDIVKAKQDFIKDIESHVGNDVTVRANVAGELQSVYNGYLNDIKSMNGFLSNWVSKLRIDNKPQEADSVQKLVEEYQEREKQISLEQTKGQVRGFTNTISQLNDPNSDLHRERLTQLNLGMYSGDYGRQMSNMGHYANDTIMNVNEISRNVENRRYGGRESSALNHVNVQGVEGETQKIQLMLQAFEEQKKQIVSKMNSGNMDEAKEEFKALIKLSENISSGAKNYGSLIKIYDKKTFDKLPEEVKHLVNTISLIIKNTQLSNEDVFKLKESLNLSDKDIEGLKKVNKELGEVEDRFENISGKSKSFLDTLKTGLSGVFSPLGSLTKGLGAALGIGIPLSLGQYWSGAMDYQKQQGRWESDAIGTDLAMGNMADIVGARDRIQRQGLYYHNMTHGLIGFDEPNKHYMNIARVGGQYGASDEQSIRDLNLISDQTFALSKVYNISDSTIAKAVQTFYKDLRMGAEEASYTIGRLAQSAAAANIPVDQYVSSIASLASEYRKMGLSADTAIIVMDKLMGQGLPGGSGLIYEDAQDIAGGFGSATRNMANDWGWSAYTSILTGQTTNMWEGIYTGMDKFDSSGNVRADYADTMAARLDAKIGMIGLATSGDPYAQGSFVQKELLKMGFSDKSADILTDAWMQDKDLFKELVKKDAAGELTDDQKQTVVLQNQAVFESKLGAMADSLSTSDKAMAALTEGQWQLAVNTEALTDMMESTLVGAINKLNETISLYTGTLVQTITSVINSPFGKNVIQPVGNALAEHPIETIATGLLAFQGLKVGGRALSNWVSGSSAAAGAAASGSKAGKFLGKAGKVALPLALGAGLVYFGSKAFGGSKDDEYDMDEGYIPYSPQGGLQSGMLPSGLEQYIQGQNFNPYSYPTNISQYGSGLQVPSHWSPTTSSPQQIGATVFDYTASNNLVANTQVNSELNRQFLEYLRMDNLGIPSGDKSIFENAAFGIGDAYLSKGLTSVSKGITSKGLGSAIPVAGQLLIDGAYNFYDPVKHSIKGDGVSEDWGKATAGFISDASLTVLGAAIGTAIAPGIGTAVGAGLGGIAQIFNGGMKGDLTKAFTGLNEEDIELKRSLKSGLQIEISEKQLKLLGLNDKEVETFRNALNDHAASLQGLTSEEKWTWVMEYMQRVAKGESEDKVVKDLKTIFDDKLLTQDSINKMNQLLEQLLAKNGIVAEPSIINDVKEEVIKTTEASLKYAKEEEEEFYKLLNNQKNKLTTKINSQDDINKILSDVNHADYKKLSEIVDKTRDQAKENVADKYAQASTDIRDDLFAMAGVDSTSFLNLIKSNYESERSKLDKNSKEYIDLSAKISQVEDYKNYYTRENFNEVDIYTGNVDGKIRTLLENSFKRSGFDYDEYLEARAISDKKSRDRTDEEKEIYKKYFNTFGSVRGKVKDAAEEARNEYGTWLMTVPNKIEELKNTWADEVVSEIKLGNDKQLGELKSQIKLTGDSKNLLSDINENIKALQSVGIFNTNNPSTPSYTPNYDVVNGKGVTSYNASPKKIKDQYDEYVLQQESMGNIPMKFEQWEKEFGVTPKYNKPKVNMGDLSGITGATTYDNMDMVALSAILKYESSGNYGAVLRNDEGASSIGTMQWRADRARNLLRSINDRDTSFGLSGLGLDKSWEHRILSESEKELVSKALSSKVGVEEQQKLMKKDIDSYLNAGKNTGITDPETLAYFADMYNQSPKSANRIANTAVSKFGTDVTLEEILSLALNDKVLGSGHAKYGKAFANRRQQVANLIRSGEVNIEDLIDFGGDITGTGDSSSGLLKGLFGYDYSEIQDLMGSDNLFGKGKLLTGISSYFSSGPDFNSSTGTTNYLDSLRNVLNASGKVMSIDPQGMSILSRQSVESKLKEAAGSSYYDEFGLANVSSKDAYKSAFSDNSNILDSYSVMAQSQKSKERMVIQINANKTGDKEETEKIRKLVTQAIESAGYNIDDIESRLLAHDEQIDFIASEVQRQKY